MAKKTAEKVGVGNDNRKASVALSTALSPKPLNKLQPNCACPGNNTALRSAASDKTIAFVTHDRSLNAKISCRTIECVFSNKVLITRDLSSQEQP